MDNLQPEKAELLRSLHHNGSLLMLPNIWNVLGAVLLEQVGYPAVATASGAMSFTNGYNDGENLPFGDLLLYLDQIAGSVSVPVTADVESCYAHTTGRLEENVKRLIQTGIAGINFEDGKKKTDRLWPIDDQCERIQTIKRVGEEMGVPLFINARTDSYIKDRHSSEEAKLEETIKRGKAYKEAGADCLYPILLKDEEPLRQIAKEVAMPVNIMMLPGIPDFATLKEIGVARVSLGSGFLRIAVNALKNTAEKLLHQENMEDIESNPITSAYIQTLTPKL